MQNSISTNFGLPFAPRLSLDVVSASGGEFYVTAQPAAETAFILLRHMGIGSSVRNPAKAIELLHQMGATEWRLILPRGLWSVPGWRPQAARYLRKQRRAHQAAAHDIWFRQQVNLLIRGRLPNANGTPADVKRQSAIKRAAWLAAAREKAAIDASMARIRHTNPV